MKASYALQQRRISAGLAYAALSLAGLAILVPFCWMVSTAFKPAPEILMKEVRLLPIEWTLENFQNVFRRVRYFTALYNTLLISSVSTAITIFFSTMIGYGIAKFRAKGLNLIFILFLSAMMFPPFIIAISLYILAAQVGAINTFWGVILPFAISNFGIFLMRQYCLGVPDDLLSAARIDGSSELGILVRVVFPVVASGCAALGILKFLMTWNDFFFPLLMLQSERMMTLQVVLSTFIDFEYYTDYGLVMALTTLIVAPVVALFFVFQRAIMEGVTISGIKG